MSKENMAKIAVEASRLRKDYPEISYEKAIEKAREIYEDAKKISKMEKAN